jgi:hypothetical protein
MTLMTRSLRTPLLRRSRRTLLSYLPIRKAMSSIRTWFRWNRYALKRIVCSNIEYMMA